MLAVQKPAGPIACVVACHHSVDRPARRSRAEVSSLEFLGFGTTHSVDLQVCPKNVKIGTSLPKESLHIRPEADSQFSPRLPTRGVDRTHLGVSEG